MIGRCTQTHNPTRTFFFLRCSRSCSQTHTHVCRIVYTSALLWFKVRLDGHYIKPSFADLPNLSATVTIFNPRPDTTVPCPSLTNILRADSMSSNITVHHSNKGYEPNCEMEKSGNFATVDRMTMTTQLLTCPTSRCSFPRVHMFRRTTLQW